MRLQIRLPITMTATHQKMAKRGTRDMASVLNFVEHIPPEQRRRPPELKHEGGYYRTERRIWHDDSVCKNFHEAAAWSYLFGMAEHEPNGRKRQICGHEFHVERSQLLTSESALAKYFGWSNHKVHRFLDRLARYHRITVIPVQGPSRGRPGAVQLGILVTICNYDHYQPVENLSSRGRPALVHDASDSSKKEEKKEGRVSTESHPNTETPSRKTETDNQTPSSDRPDGLPATAGGKRRRRRSDLSAELLGEFETWWKQWAAIPGTKVDRGHAEAAFRTARERTDLATLIRGVNRYLAFCKASGKEVRYIKYPATWLNGKCWEDDLPDAEKLPRKLSSQEIGMIKPWGTGGYAWYPDHQQEQLRDLGLWPVEDWMRRQAGLID